MKPFRYPRTWWVVMSTNHPWFEPRDCSFAESSKHHKGLSARDILLKGRSHHAQVYYTLKLEQAEHKQLLRLLEDKP